MSSNQPSRYEPDPIRTLADLDAWVERETPELAPQPRRRGLSPEGLEAAVEIIFGRGVQPDSHVLAAIQCLRTHWRPLRRPILKDVHYALYESFEKSKSEIVDSLRERDKLRSLEQIGQDNEIYPYRPFWRLGDLAVLTALFASFAEGLREQHRIRVWFPESVREQPGCTWRNYKEPFTPANYATEAPRGIYRAWYRQQIRHWYADSLLPGYKLLLEEHRQSMEYGRWLETFTDAAARTGTSYFGSMEPGSDAHAHAVWRSGQFGDADTTHDEAPGFEEKLLVDRDTDVEDEVVEGLGGQQQAQAILKLLNANEVAWLERYASAQARGLSDKEFALEEGVLFATFRKRKQRIGDRIKSMSQTDGNLGLVDRERSENEVNAAALQEQNEVLRDVRDRLDALLVGLEDTVSVLVWKFPEREAEIRGKAGEIFAALSTSNPDMEEAA